MLFLYIVGIIFIYPVYLLYFKRKTYYVNKKIQSRHIKGGAILLSNHKGFKDFMLYMCAFPFRKVYCLMSEKVFSFNKILNILIRSLGGIRVDRTKFEFSFIDKSVKLLNKNKLLLIFPEGKLPTSNTLGSFYPSYIMIALKSGKPIIPIYTPGEYKFFKRNKMVVGTPIYIRDYIKNENPTKEEIDYANNEIRKEILKLEKFYRYNVKRDKYHKAFKPSAFLCDLAKIILFLSRFGLFSKTYNKGKHNYKLKEKENMIIIANHTSFADPILLFRTFWRRRLKMIVADIVFNNHKLRSFLLRNLGCIKVNREKPSLSSLVEITDMLNCGCMLSIFPEGHINKDKELDDFKTGAAYFSLKTNTKILPIYIKPKEKGRYKLYLGEYIYPSGNINTENINNYNNLIKEKINQLIKENSK